MKLKVWLTAADNMLLRSTLAAHIEAPICMTGYVCAPHTKRGGEIKPLDILQTCNALLPSSCSMRKYEEDTAAYRLRTTCVIKYFF